MASAAGGGRVGAGSVGGGLLALGSLAADPLLKAAQPHAECKKIRKQVFFLYFSLETEGGWNL